MYSLIYNIYFRLKRKQKKRKNSFFQKILDRIEWFYKIQIINWYKKHPSSKIGASCIL